MKGLFGCAFGKMAGEFEYAELPVDAPSRRVAPSGRKACRQMVKFRIEERGRVRFARAEVLSQNLRAFFPRDALEELGEPSMVNVRNTM